MDKKSNQNIVTAVAILIALVAVLYAVMIKTSAAPEVVAESTTDEAAYSEGDQNPVVLKIDGREVTRAEILDNFAQSKSTLPEGTTIQQIFPLLQEQYLVGYLLGDAARDAGINGTTPEVARKIEEAREQALRAVYIEQLSNTSVTDADVRKAYDDIVANSPAVMERSARHILVQTEAEANGIIAKLKSGDDFTTLAKETSTGPSGENGGDLGYFAKDEMVPEFANAAFSMPIGSVSDTPVKTQFGYHVIKILAERERAKPTFDEIKPQLEQQLRQAVVREKIAELRNKATIAVYDFDGQPIPVKEDATVAPAAAETPSTDTTTDAPVTEEAPAATDATATSGDDAADSAE